MKEDIIVFSNQPAVDYPFRIISAGTSYCDGTYRIFRRNSPIWVFEYVEKGVGRLQVNGNEFDPEAGDVYIVPYGSDHEYFSSAKDPWIKHWFNVAGPLVGHLLNLYNLNGSCLFKKCLLKDIFISGLKKLEDNPTDASHLTGPAVIMDIILNLSLHRERLYESITVSPKATRLRLFLEKKVFDEAPTIADMCSHVRLSSAHINRIFKKDFGMSPYHYLLNLKIEAAKELLTTSVMQVREIAFKLGFSDEYYFSNIFKKKTGMAPRYFRSSSSCDGC